MATIASLIVEISAKSIKLKKHLSESTKSVRKFVNKSNNNFKNIGKGIGPGLSKALSKIKKFSKSAIKSLAAIAAVWTTGFIAKVGAVAAIVLANSKAAKELINVSNAIGVSVKNLTEWTSVAKTVGIESEKMNDILKDTADKIGDYLATGGGEAADVFERLKLKTKDFIDLNSGDALLKIGKAMSRLTSKEQVFLMESLADEASKLLPLFKNNAAGYKKAIDDAVKSGNILTRSQAEGAASFAKSIETLKSKIRGFGKQATVQLSKPFSLVIDLINQAIDRFGGIEKVAKSFAISFIDGIAKIIEAGASLFNFFKDIKIGLLEIKLKAQEALKAITFVNAAEIGGKLFDKDFKINIFGDTSKTAADIKDLEKSVSNTTELSEKAKKIAQDLRDSTGKGVESAASKAGRVYSNSASKVQSLADAADKAARALTPKQGTKKERGSVTDLGDMSSRIKAQQVYKNATQNMQDNAGLSGFGKALDGIKSNVGNVKSMQQHIDESQAGKALQEMRLGKFGRNSGTSLSDVSSPDSAEANGKFYTGESLKKVMKQDSATRIMKVRDLNDPKNSIMIDLKTDYGEVAGHVLVNDEFVAGLKRIQNSNTNEVARMAAV